MKTTLIAALGAVTLGLSAFAALEAQEGPALPGAVDPARITRGTYQADSAHSLVQWRVNHFGFNDYFGLFGDVSGTLTIDPAQLGQASVDVTIPIASVTVASDGLRDHLLRAGTDGGAPDFFGPEPQPARFVSKSVAVSPGGMTADITGDLTLNGVTREVVLATRFTGAGANPMSKAETVGFEGTTTIKRSDYGIAFALPVVSDDVELEFTAAFEKAAAE
ncbi:YceI family protein [Pelagerythrobacter sp.]|uniref:YceI family protein n=1 Tax=Pelagerythrobacter sp. TaxID=2800702 RepID=UPI0035B1B9C8